jgi:hypothetical protein
VRFNSLTQFDWQLALGLSAAALALRLLFVAFYPASALASSDQLAYWSFAQGIAAGQGFRATVEPWLADRPPLYSLFLAGIFKAAGENELAVFVAQALLDAIAAGLWALIGVRLLGRSQGAALGLLFVVLPHTWLFTKQILTENLYLFLLAGLIALLVLPSRFNWRWGLSIGLIIGLIALVRREAIFLAAAILIWTLFWRGRSEASSVWIPLGVTGLAAGFVVGLWLLRNWIDLGAPVMSSSSGWNFMVGNHPLSTGRYALPPADWLSQFAGVTELERDRLAWALSLAWIAQSPLDWLRLFPLKLLALWGPAFNWILDGVDVLLLGGALAGLWQFRRRKDNWLFVAGLSMALILSVTFGGFLIVGGWRYRFAVYPGVLLLVAYGVPIEQLLARWGGRWRAHGP